MVMGSDPWLVLAGVAFFFACYTGHLGPSGPKSKKSPKMGSRGREALGVDKVEKESKMDCFLLLDFLRPFSKDSL